MMKGQLYADLNGAWQRLAGYDSELPLVRLGTAPYLI